MKPTLGITIGDPAGIGPEITVKALQDGSVHQCARFLLIGTAEILGHTARALGIDMAFPTIDPALRGWASGPDSVPVYQVGNLTEADYQIGKVAANTGRDSVAYVEAAAKLGMDGLINAIVTAPINKEAKRAANIQYPGHTEILAAAMSAHVETMFVVDKLRIFFLTRHVALREAILALSQEGLLNLIRHAREFLIQFGISDPVIGVAALNPHASDGGQFGDEEARMLVPAIKRANSKGWKAIGPIGADSIFHQALQGKYDAVISLYHDQGHIAAKTYDFNRTVSVTTGLPIIRTSVDHGTAFDIAGQGIADPTNMIEAIRVAANMAAHFAARATP